jgi:hypothetical protein|tara:strand:- start:32 stop:691 length:660 start_codon:yes stop_codon:yes gene_type:complete
VITIDNYTDNDIYKRFFEVVKANAPESYGGVKLYDGERNYLMQIPEEFSSLLTFFVEQFGKKEIKFLEIGTASNLTNSMFWNHLNIVENIMVDNLECPGVAKSLWGNLSYKQNSVLLVGDSTSDKIHSKVSSLDLKYDIIFCDGNHEYNYVKKDFEFYSKLLNENGYFVFHDIDCKRAPDVKRFIGELDRAAELKKVCEFINKDYKYDCGIGVYKNETN